MSATVPSVLLLEDAAAALPFAEIRPDAQVTRVGTRQEYLDHLESTPFDLVLSSGTVPGCEGIEAFHLARARRPEVAFVLMVGAEPADTDVRGLLALGIRAVSDPDDLGPAVELALSPDRPGVDPNRLLAGHELLLTVTRELSQVDDLPQLKTAVQTAARRLTGADHVTLAVRQGPTCHYADELGESPVWKDRRYPLGQCPSGWTMQHRRPAVISDLGTDPRTPAGFADARRQSAVIVPVGAGAPVAAIGVYWDDPGDPPDNTRAVLLQALADSTAVALEGLRSRQRLATAAADRTAELTALTYAVSHDLRAPIRHLEGFSRILLQEIGDQPQARHNAQRIQDAAVHLREMVNGMLTLSRIAQVEVHPQPVDLAALAREVAQSLANAPAPSTGPARAGVVEFVAPANLPVVGDPRLLQTALQDLLGNAWKFTSRIPRPRVEIGVVPVDPAESDDPVHLGPVCDPVYFVRDNGAGFDPTASGRLFGVFQRLHSGEDFPGTGVGLASVKRIVGKHGGTVRATGTPDQGATFYFTLPPTP